MKVQNHTRASGAEVSGSFLRNSVRLQRGPDLNSYSQNMRDLGQVGLRSIFFFEERTFGADSGADSWRLLPDRLAQHLHCPHALCISHRLKKLRLLKGLPDEFFCVCNSGVSPFKSAKQTLSQSYLWRTDPIGLLASLLAHCQSPLSLQLGFAQQPLNHVAHRICQVSQTWQGHALKMPKFPQSRQHTRHHPGKCDALVDSLTSGHVETLT